MEPEKNQKNTVLWMIISGTAGATFFVVANFHVFAGKEVLAGCIQLMINAFVYCAFSRGRKSKGGIILKLVGLGGSIIPIFMAGWTLCRVLIPALYHYITH